MFTWEMILGNISSGYSEAACRALQKGFLREEQYNHLIQCSNLSDFKQVLDETDYSKYLVGMNSGMDGKSLDSIELRQRLYQKLRDEMEYIMGQADEPLCSFLNIMMHNYQIENIISFISGHKNQQDPGVTKKSLNPLGEFAGLKSVSSLADQDDNFVKLF